MTTETVRKWICESAGSSTTRPRATPTCGIPVGTSFDDIPADWFCPVCGARKADFSLYED